MSSDFSILSELTLVIVAAALAGMVFQRVRVPIVLGYIVAGLVIGPHVTGAVAHVHLVEMLSELGVILLFFTIGLEFSVRTIARVGVATLLTVLVEQGLIAIVVYGTGRALGWTSLEAVFAAVGVGIASTMLVVKGLEAHGKRGPDVELILAIMVVEDLLSILLLAVMTGAATGAGMSAGDLAVTIGKLAGFLVGMVVVGMLGVPRMVRAVARSERSELLLLTSLGTCFGMVWIAVRAGYSVALGAFVAGMLIAESGKGHDVDVLVKPFRDAFAAIFFIAIGMTIAPVQIAGNWFAAVVLAVVLVIGKTTGVTIAAFLTGNSVRNAVQAGLALSQIGEFAFIVVAVGASAGVVRGELLPIVVGASCITAISGSWQICGSGRVATWLDARLPNRIATFVTFYEAWIGRLRDPARRDTLWRRIRKPIIVTIVDAALLIAIVIGAATAHAPIVDYLQGTDIDPRAGLYAFVALVAVVSGLFVVAITRNAVRLARLLAAHVIATPPTGELPEVAGAVALPPVDLGRSPRRALELVLALAIVLVVGLPIAAVTQPFVPGGALVVLVVLVMLSLVARRSIKDFSSHVRAGSALIVEVLARQGAEHVPPRLAEVETILPGFEGVTPIVLPERAPAVGRSLAELDLRAKTGVTVLSIMRDSGSIPNPSPRDPLQAGDVLAIAGSADAVEAARRLLLDAPTEPATA
jgi:CPA2 family monovalent cation:H+ antiporter-2